MSEPRADTATQAADASTLQAEDDSAARRPDGAERQEPGGAGDGQEMDLLKRERADFLNYKRRVERERAEDRVRARDAVLSPLLPVLDELDRALSYLPTELSENQWAQGVVLGHRALLNALRQMGVELVGSPGEPFDPALHDAVAYQPRNDVPHPQVMEVVRPGFRSDGRLLRPAQVVVAGPSDGGDEGARAASPAPAAAENAASYPQSRAHGHAARDHHRRSDGHR